MSDADPAQSPDDEPTEWTGEIACVQLAVDRGAALDAPALLSWTERWLAAEMPNRRDLTVRLVGEEEMRRLNRDYRDKDRPTDVLSFPGEETPDGDPLGDVVIALPVAARQAVEAGHGLEDELQILILHGCLHCLGYDHETDDGEMEALEARLRRRWLPRGSGPRSGVPRTEVEA